jgi:hypothetical protein
MADHLVDPHRRLVAEGRGQGVLAMRRAAIGISAPALGKLSYCRKRLAD